MINKSDRNQDRKTLHLTLIRDVPYASLSEAQKLDVYMLPALPKPYPVIIWMHPGGFQDGDKDGRARSVTARINMITFFRPMLERGYAVVSINHRLSQEAKFPALIHDVKTAVRWVKANAAEYDFNADKVAAWGSSSGGYLAAMLATTGDVAELEDLTLGNPDVSSRINVAVDWYGPLDFSTMDEQHIQLGHQANVHDPESPESRLMGASISAIPEKCKAATPMTYVGKGNAPLYIQHGTADLPIPYLQSVALIERMAAAIGKENAKIDLIEGVGHADMVFFTDENVNKMLDFVDKYTK